MRRQHIDVKKLPEVIRCKWGDVVIEEGFVPLPKKILRVLKDLFHPETRLVFPTDFGVVMAVADIRGSRVPMTVENIAFLVGLEDDTDAVFESLDRLQQANYIEVTPIDGGPGSLAGPQRRAAARLRISFDGIESFIDGLSKYEP